MTDIGGFLGSFLSIVLGGFTTAFNTLDNIGFSGISLLDFILTVFLIGTVVPLIFTLLRSRRSGSSGRSKAERRKNNEE